MKRAIITGISGQDGSYLTELLLEKGYEVHGIIRRSSSFNTGRIDHLYQEQQTPGSRLFLHYGDLTDMNSMVSLLQKVKPVEVYHLAAQSHVKASFDLPIYTVDVSGLGTCRLLNAIMESGVETRFYQASSSEMYGKAAQVPQNEKTPFYPRSPYAYAKLMAYWATVNYREAYGLYACNGILFNHESPRRGETFVTRKITRGIAKILAGKNAFLYLGNLDAKRDWGYAKEYVEAMWRMLQQEKPDDYVIATGETHSVREFLNEAFGLVGLSWEDHVKYDPKYFRSTEVDILLGDPSKAKEKIGWRPLVKFDELIRIMVEADLALEGLDPKSYMKASSRKKKTPKLAHPGAVDTVSKQANIFVAGHSGLVGSALIHTLKNRGYQNLLLRTHSELELLDKNAVETFFQSNEIDYVFVAAARVGGIIANRNRPADFLYENAVMGINLIHAAAKYGVKRLVYLGSSCIYPRLAIQPIREEYLLTGPLEPTNEGYAIAKIACLKLCEMVARQESRDFVSVMPTNLYGPCDNFHPTDSHVIPGILRKMHEAKTQQKADVTVWGTGLPRREFLYVDDLADALCLVLETPKCPSMVNVGCGKDYTIKELTELVQTIVGFNGKIKYDHTMPDGTPQKLLDNSKIRSIGWAPKTALRDGLTKTYQWALENQVFENQDKHRRAA